MQPPRGRAVVELPTPSSASLGRLRTLAVFRAEPKTLDFAVAVAGAIGFVVFSWLFVLVDHAAHGGDFGQYVTQARNVIQGRSWSHLMEGYPAILPGYPLLLAVVTAVAGVDFKLYGLANSVLWAGVALVFFRHYYDAFGHRVSAFAFFLCVLLCPVAIELQAEVQPNILFSLTLALALVAGTRLADPNCTFRQRLSWFPLMLAPGLVRAEAIALFAALALCFLLALRIRLVLVCVAAIAGVVALDVAIALTFDQESNFAVVTRQFERSVPDPAAEGSLPAALSGIAYMATTYVDGLTQMSWVRSAYAAGPEISISYGTGLVAVTFLPAILLFGLAVAGAWSTHTVTLDKAFFVFFLGLLSAFLLEGTTRLRYLLPILPVFWYYVFIGTERIVSEAPGRLVPAAAFAVAIALLTPVAIGAADRYQIPSGRNVTDTPEMRQVVAWIADNDRGAGVAYFKPRPMTMLLDGRAPSVPVKLLRSTKDAARYLDSPGFILVVRKLSSFQQPEILRTLADNPNAELVLDNAEMAVFQAVHAATGPDATP